MPHHQTHAGRTQGIPLSAAGMWEPLCGRMREHGRVIVTYVSHARCHSTWVELLSGALFWPRRDLVHHPTRGPAASNHRARRVGDARGRLSRMVKVGRYLEGLEISPHYKSSTKERWVLVESCQSTLYTLVHRGSPSPDPSGTPTHPDTTLNPPLGGFKAPRMRSAIGQRGALHQTAAVRLRAVARAPARAASLHRCHRDEHLHQRSNSGSDCARVGREGQAGENENRRGLDDQADAQRREP